VARLRNATGPLGNVWVRPEDRDTVCDTLAEAQQENARLTDELMIANSLRLADSLDARVDEAEALTRTLARALDDADGGMEAERRRQKVLGDPRVQALLKENTP